MVNLETITGPEQADCDRQCQEGGFGSVVWKFFGFAAIIFIISAVWSVTTPLGAGPDEANQMVTAFAVVHGQIGHDTVEVPEYISALTEKSEVCFVGSSDWTADCQGELSQSVTLVSDSSQFGTYFPLYFLVVGLPTLFLHGTVALFAMRLMSAAMFSLLIGAALALSYKKLVGERVLMVGVLCSLTPMALFLGGVVNSSSFEIGAALVTWVAALHAFPRYAGKDEISTFKVTVLLVVSILLLASRLLAPIWLLLILAAVLTINSAWHRFFRLITSKLGIISVAVIGLGTAITLLWALTHPSYYVGVGTPPNSFAGAVSTFVNTLVRNAPNSLLEAAGVLGWLDTSLQWAPLFIYSAWGLLVGMALARSGQRREALVLGAVAVLGVIVPIALETLAWGGVGWQGRYSLPFLIGIPILSTAVLSRSVKRDSSDVCRRPMEIKWGLRFAVALLGLSAVYGLVINYHRYSVGMSSPLDETGVWHGVLGFWGPLIAYIVAGGLLAWVALGLWRPRLGHRP